MSHLALALVAWTSLAGGGGGTAHLRASRHATMVASAPAAAIQIWVTNFNNGTITRLDTDGAVIGTSAAGTNPASITYDGTNIWVTDAFFEADQFLRFGLDGGLNASVTVSANSYGSVYDGTQVWYTPYNPGTATGFNPADGGTLHTFAGTAGVSLADALGYDGTSIWMSNQSGGATIARFDLTGAFTDTIDVGGGSSGFAFDGTAMWVGVWGTSKVVKVTNGVVTGTFNTGTTPLGLAFDGTLMWVTNYSSNNVYRYQLDGGLVGISQLTRPRGIAFDGTSIWVASNSTGTVKKLDILDGGVVGSFTVGSGPHGVATTKYTKTLVPALQ